MINPMSAFEGVKFDCELSSSPNYRHIHTSHLARDKQQIAPAGYHGYLPVNRYPINSFSYCRPRLNIPQVLDDWSFLADPVCEGMVWEARVCRFVTGGYLHTNDTYQHATHRTQNFSNKQICKFMEHDGLVEWAAFKGVKAGSLLEAWAKANDVPILEVD